MKLYSSPTATVHKYWTTPLNISGNALQWTWLFFVYVVVFGQIISNFPSSI